MTLGPADWFRKVFLTTSNRLGASPESLMRTTLARPVGLPERFTFVEHVIEQSVGSLFSDARVEQGFAVAEFR